MDRDEPTVYFDGMHYDAWTEREVDIPFYLDQAEKYQDPILELGCGTGRLTIPIAKKGYDIKGLDISRRFLKLARKKASREDLDIDWIRADMRHFSLDRRFGLILIPFNSIHHILTLEDMEMVLENVRKHLRDKGRLIVEFFNPDLDILNRDPQEEHEIMTYDPPGEEGEITVMEKTRYDKAEQMMHITWIFEQEEKIQKEWLTRIYFPKEVNAIIKYNDLYIEEKYGDFDESPLTNNSGQQIVVCRKDNDIG